MRRLQREAGCLILGFVLSLGYLVPSTLHPNVGSAASASSHFLTHLDLPRVDADYADATAAKCLRVMKKCRADALTEQEQQRKLAKEKQRRERLQNPSGKQGQVTVVKASISRMSKGNKRTNAPVSVGSGPGCNETRNPFSSMRPFYPNRALESELRKHDRWVVDSMAYLSGFNGGGNEDYIQPGPKRITLAILTVNRSVPYLAVLLTTLLRGHEPATLGKYIDLHVINIERRPCRCRYTLFSDLEERLPFATFHDWTSPYPLHANITDANRMYKSNQRLDYIRVMELCQAQGSDFCLIMEDDAAASANLAPKFINATAGLDVNDLLVLALYVPYNDYWSGERYLRNLHYAENSYEDDERALKWMDPDTVDGPSPRVRYRIEDLGEVKYGLVANAYPRRVLGRITQHLRGEDSTTCEYTDVFLMNTFVKESGLKKLGVNPSLVAHIGHYSEHNINSNALDGTSTERRCHSKMFTKMSVDARFQLDDGWEAGG